MDINEIKKLADLARIDMSEEEMTEIAKDFQSILAYVGQVQEISDMGEVQDKNKEDYFIRNVMREDVSVNADEKRTDKILTNAPDTQARFIKVKQIM